MSTAFYTEDSERIERCGRPEVLFCEGKSPEQTAEIFLRLSTKQPFVLGTRASAEHFDAVREKNPAVVYHPAARLIALGGAPKSDSGLRVGVVAAGTSDYPVLEEAAVTLEIYGWEVERVIDVGVAGIHRLFQKLDVLRSCSVLVVVAGMEGALASVVGGLVRVPVIAVPTSIGYGANFSGLTPLLTMLNSCASGTAVVNIDNGFGAAAAADSILRLVVENRAAQPNLSK